jgi:serine/threonine-protein kinase
MNIVVRLTLFFALFVALGLAFGLLTFKILSFSRTVKVPSVVNLTVIEADKALGIAGLVLKIEGEDYDSLIPSGKIIRQDIPPGNKVKERRAIRVVISKGPRVYSLPLLVNDSLENAHSLLMEKGLRIGKTISVHSDTVEKGLVIAQKPEPDERVSDEITVLVSAGPHDHAFSCPNFQDKELEAVADMAGKMGLKIDTRGSGSIVVFQKPKPGAIIKGGDTIYLTMKEVM